MGVIQNYVHGQQPGILYYIVMFSDQVHRSITITRSRYATCSSYFEYLYPRASEPVQALVLPNRPAQLPPVTIIHRGSLRLASRLQLGNSNLCRQNLLSLF